MKKYLQARILPGIVLLVVSWFSFPVVSSAQVNNLCGNATVLISSPTCFNTAGTLVGATYTAVANACGAASRNDVWYSFVAHSSTPTITISGALASNQPSIQLFTNCAGTLAPAPNCVTNNPVLNCAGLLPGGTYLVRIFSNNNTASTFNICITESNDVCANAFVLNSTVVPTCSNVPGNLYGSTTSATTINAPNCASGVNRDVWYRFVAETTNPTITVSGVTFANPGVQLLSNNCGGSFTSYYCGTTSIAADFLTPGNTYYVRVYSTAAAAPLTPAAAAFNICIQDPVSPPPANDNCANAVNISVMSTCNTIPGTMAGATVSAPALSGLCAGPLAYDVWYKFKAISASTVIDLANIGTDFQNPGIEVFSGTCGSLTAIACGSEPLTVPGLTIGTTYYIRVYSRTAPVVNGDANFNICLTSPTAPIVRYGNSYVNITKKTTGGVVEPGDILEIRMTIHHTSGTGLTNARYLDNVPSKTTMLTGATDFIKIITNEGLTYKQYTRAAGDDAAVYNASPPAGQFNIRMNIGFASNPGIPVNTLASESASAIGGMSSGNRPTLFGSSLLFATAYRVRVTGVVGDTITLNPAQFIYRAGGGDITLTATPYKIVISNPLSLCSNSIGLNNALESGGTFGNGAGLNRGTDLQNPIAGYSFVNNINGYNSLGDGRYSIVNNISPRSRTIRTANRVPNCGSTLLYGDPLNCNNRMHGGHWYIDGDHTGTNNNIGNVPPNAAASSGYMLMVNADYVASEVYSQTLTNLCPNTYYEFSAWVRNICPTCGADSTGAQFAGTPTAPSNGYPGVLPNLTFALNGLDYYSTGEIDTVGWVKKGFVFRTDTSHTATFTIRNNSQGGGGNDWVMDDIAVATCLPSMHYSPTINPNVCAGNSITIADTISSFFRNYTTYKWQRSTNGGASWTDITGVTSLSDTNYYITSFTIPPGNTTVADSGDLYRVVVATTPANLLNVNCNISDGVTITLSVNNCGIPLKTDLLSFNGKLINDKGNLAWTTSKEDGPLSFTIEKSYDGNYFSAIGTVNSHNDFASPVNSYTFIDPVPITSKVYYRLKMLDPSGAQKYSRIINLSKQSGESFGLSNVINPFSYTLDFDITSIGESKIDVELIDLFGKVVRKNSFQVHAGVNALSLTNTETLPAGAYIFRIKNNELLINKKVLKRNN